MPATLNSLHLAQERYADLLRWPDVAELVEAVILHHTDERFAFIRVRAIHQVPTVLRDRPAVADLLHLERHGIEAAALHAVRHPRRGFAIHEEERQPSGADLAEVVEVPIGDQPGGIACGPLAGAISPE